MRAFMLAGAPTLLCKRSRVDKRRCPEQAHQTSLVAKGRVILRLLWRIQSIAPTPLGRIFSVKLNILATHVDIQAPAPDG